MYSNNISINSDRIILTFTLPLVFPTKRFHLHGTIMFILPILALATLTQAQVPGLNFGPSYMMQRTSSYLIEYTTILRVPKYPDSSKGLIVIWPGINTDARPTNLVQTCIGAAGARSFVSSSINEFDACLNSGRYG